MSDSSGIREEFGRQATEMANAPAFRSTDNLARIINALGPSPVGRVLDLACGPGIVAEAIAPWANELEGIDATPEMIALATKRLAQAGNKNAHFQVSPAEHLPFADKHFDAVVTRLTLHHFTDIDAVLKETRRVTSPSGKFIVGEIITSADADDAALHNAFERLRDPTHLRMFPRDELLALLESAGFQIVAMEAWDQPRNFTEWAKIVAQPARTEPLKQVMHAFARLGVHAGIGLREADGEIYFTHSWVLLTAQPRV